MTNNLYEGLFHKVHPNILSWNDRKTALVNKDIANSVHPMIQMEEDYPSNHSNGKLPILDLKCSIDSEIMVKFEHFEKPTADKLVLDAWSALHYALKK
jgi:hypothetical protein